MAAPSRIAAPRGGGRWRRRGGRGEGEDGVRKGGLGVRLRGAESGGWEGKRGETGETELSRAAPKPPSPPSSLRPLSPFPLAAPLPLPHCVPSPPSPLSCLPSAQVFRRVGEIKRIVMGLDKLKLTPCGFCFVIYYTRADAEACVRYLSGTLLDDRLIRADFDWGFREGRQFGRGRSGGQVRDEYRMDYDAGRGGYGIVLRNELQARQQLLQMMGGGEGAEGDDGMGLEEQWDGHGAAQAAEGGEEGGEDKGAAQGWDAEAGAGGLDG